MAGAEFDWEKLDGFHLADDYCKKAEATLNDLLRAIETTIRLFEPEWDRSTARPKKRQLSPRLVPEHSGLVASTFRVMRVAEESMTVFQIAAEVARDVKVGFKRTDQKQRLCSAIYNTLKRYEAKGIVQSFGGKPAKWAIVKEIEEAA